MHLLFDCDVEILVRWTNPSLKLCVYYNVSEAQEK